MVGIGILMLALVLTGNLMRRGGRLYSSRRFLRVCEIAAPCGFVAVLAGWVTTEVGRQPWTVYGLMRTADSVSPSLTGANVLVSFIGYIAVYLVVFPAGLIIMSRILRRGPEASEPFEPVESGRPAEPVRALTAAVGEGAHT
jgi:cytochrome d ubiquinol oxidase subunit I